MSDEMREEAVRCPYCGVVVYAQFFRWFNDREWKRYDCIEPHDCGGAAA